MSFISAPEIIVWILALPLLFSPGWLLIFWLFPDERPSWQVAVGGGIGIVLLGLMVLILSYLPLGITHDTIVIAIVLLNGLLAILIWSAPNRVLSRLTRLVSDVRSGRELAWRNYLAPASTILVLTVFLLTTLSLNPRQRESYTEFYIVDGLQETPPWRRSTNVSDPVALTLAVVSSEQTATSFSIQVVIEEKTVEVISLGVLEPGEGIQRSITVPQPANREQRVELFLYKGNAESPYRSLFFWLPSPSEPLGPLENPSNSSRSADFAEAAW
jgi:uncharacterized membrane protein